MKIHAPNRNYTGVSASVAFCNGMGETDNPHLLNWFRNHGYEVVEPERESVVDSMPEPESMTDLTSELEVTQGKKAGVKKAGE